METILLVALFSAAVFGIEIGIKRRKVSIRRGFMSIWLFVASPSSFLLIKVHDASDKSFNSSMDDDGRVCRHVYAKERRPVTKCAYLDMVCRRCLLLVAS